MTGVAAAAVAVGVADPAFAATLDDAFDKAAATYDVPRALLVAIGTTETRLDNHGGKPSASGGYGVMHLVENPKHHTLPEAAAATGLSPARLRTNDASNILGAAAVLDTYAKKLGLSTAQRKGLEAWYPAVASYGGAQDANVAALYADAVYATLATEPGVRSLAVAPQADVSIASTDYPAAAWVAASTSNYTAATRPTSNAINKVVIHTTQGSYAGAISWFQNPAAQVSAHYTIRSSDGAVTQSVRDKDIAWHAGNWSYNQTSIGIEHEGYVTDASWYSEAMYLSSAALTSHLCARYGIAKTRSAIIAHSEVPGATHTDPGQHWNWSHYMSLVGGSTSTTGSAGWTTVRSGASGWRVQIVQLLLNHRGASLTVDSSFGPATLAAVSSFQSSAGLTADGVVGPQTWQSLVVQLSQGSSGSAVRALQAGLNNHGAGLTVDGQFGAGTTTALSSFQSRHGLTASGTASTVSWEWII